MKQRLHLCFFMPTITVGGVEHNLLNILNELSRRDYRLTLVTTHTPAEFAAQLSDKVTVRLVGTPGTGLGILRIFSPRVRAAISSILGLIRFLRVEKPDALYSFQGSTVAVVAKMISRFKHPIFVRESNPPSLAFIHDSNVSRYFKLLLKSRLYRKANAVLASTEGVADDLSNSMKIPREKIRVIYNPAFSPQIVEKSKEQLAHEWLQPASTIPVIVSVGRLSKQKDYCTLIESFVLVRHKVDSRLVLVGDGAERSDIEDRIRELRLTEFVDLVGTQINPYKYLARAKVFALSSIFEGFGNVMVEAQACGVPVVATDCPSGPREILLGGEAGTLVPVANPGRMAEAILNYLSDHSLVEQHVQAAFNALDRFTHERITDSYLALIKETSS